MPPKNYEPSQIFFKMEDGKYQPMEMVINIEDCAEIVSDIDSALNNPEYFKGGEIAVKTSKGTYKELKRLFQSVMPRYFTNNWRKMRHLPIIRRRGKRK